VLLGFSTAQRYSSQTVYPATLQSGPSSGQFISGLQNFDGPKVYPIVNLSSLQWWYFDTVGPYNSSVVITFFTTPASAFPLLGDQPGLLSVWLWFSFPNGSQWETTLFASQATVNVVEDGSSGLFNGTGCSWTSTPDMSRYTIFVDTDSVRGTLSLRSSAPAHYACGPAGPDESMQVAPGLGWSNAVPDATGSANFVFFDKFRLKFIGRGYHDMNWGISPWFSSLIAEYWGHAKFGPYSVVYFLILSPSGTLYTSAYVAKNGKILLTSCNSDISIIPVGSSFPPTVTSTLPTGFQLTINLGSRGTLDVQIKDLFVITQGEAVYFRWTGSVKGGIQGSGQKMYDGIALLEQFTVIP